MPSSLPNFRVYDDASYPVWTVEQCQKIGEMLDDTMEIAEQRHLLLHEEPMELDQMRLIRTNHLHFLLNAGVV